MTAVRLRQRRVAPRRARPARRPRPRRRHRRPRRSRPAPLTCAGGRVEDVALPRGAAGPRLAVDEVRDVLAVTCRSPRVRRGDRVDQDVQALVGLVLGQRQRRAHPDRRCRRGRPCRPAARAALHSSRPAARQRRVGLVRAGLDELDAEHQALAADLADDRRGRRPRRAGRRAGSRRRGRRWPAGRGRARSRAPRCRPPWRPGCRRRWRTRSPATAVHHLGPADDAGRGRSRCRCPWRRSAGPGVDAVRLVAPEVLARAPPAGLHLVGDEQDAVLVEHLLERGEAAVRAVRRTRRRPGSARRSARRRRRTVVVASTSRRSATARLDVARASDSPANSAAQPVAGVQVADVERGQRRWPTSRGCR